MSLSITEEAISSLLTKKVRVKVLSCMPFFLKHSFITHLTQKEMLRNLNSDQNTGEGTLHLLHYDLVKVRLPGVREGL